MAFGSFSVGPHTLSPNLVLAPMSGVTNSAFRRLIRECNPGCVGLVVTEFVSIEGLTRGSERSRQLIAFRDEERPLSIQIFGHDIDRMAEAAVMAQDSGADIVDINCGCPVPKVVKRGGGCELMRQPHHLEQLLVRTRRRVTIPLTLKIRSGWDENCINAVEIAKMAEGAGVEMLTVHGRTRKALYRGDADWDVVQRVAEAVKIPVVGSGDVVDLASAKQRFRPGIAALMIGRGALMNPWVFSEIVHGFTGRPYTPPPPVATPEVMLRYLTLLQPDLSERAIIGKMKQLASQVVRRVRGSSGIRRVLCTSRNLDEFTAFLEAWREALQCGVVPPILRRALERDDVADEMRSSEAELGVELSV